MKIRWFRRALNQLGAAEDYVAEDNPDAARELVARIERAVARLADYPELGRTGRVEGTRELVVSRTPYIVAYRVRDDEVVVLAVQHAARQWPARF